MGGEGEGGVRGARLSGELQHPRTPQQSLPTKPEAPGHVHLMCLHLPSQRERRHDPHHAHSALAGWSSCHCRTYSYILSQLFSIARDGTGLRQDGDAVDRPQSKEVQNHDMPRANNGITGPETLHSQYSNGALRGNTAGHRHDDYAV